MQNWSAKGKTLAIGSQPQFRSACLTGKSAALIMRKIRPEAMAEAVQLAVSEACDWFAEWTLHADAVHYSLLHHLRADTSSRQASCQIASPSMQGGLLLALVILMPYEHIFWNFEELLSKPHQLIVWILTLRNFALQEMACRAEQGRISPRRNRPSSRPAELIRQ